MAEFEPITTQEAFEAAVADRLAPYADYDTLKEQNVQLNARVQAYEADALKTRIAHEEGIPFDLAQRLTGTTEADLRKDAKSFAKLLKPAAPAAPGKAPADDTACGKKAAWRTFANNLMNKE